MALGATENNEPDIGQVTVRGIFWNSFSQFLTQAFQWVVMVILARLLRPEDFGLVGMAGIFTGLAAAVSDLGLGSAIIQRERMDERYLATVFWASFAMGVLLFGALTASASYVATFFHNPAVQPIMIVSSFGFFMGPWGVVPRSLLIRRLQFNQLAKVEVGLSVVSGITSASLALMGWGAWSIVGGGLVNSLASIILLWWQCPWYPHWCFDRAAFREMFDYGIHVTGSNVLNYFRTNLDYLIVGRKLGTSSLGFYTLAYKLMNYPRSIIPSLVTRVAFPAFSRLQNDQDHIRRGFLKMVHYISLVTVPALIGMFSVAPEFIRVTYGAKWSPAILPLQILCFTGILGSLGTMVGSTVRAIGRPDIEFKWTLFSLSLMVIALLIGVQYGTVGVATAILIVGLIMFSTVQTITNRLIGLRWQEYLANLGPALGGSGLMLAGLLAYRVAWQVCGFESDVSFLATSIMLGLLLYGGFLRYAKVTLPDQVRVVWEDFRQASRREKD